jgi:hypothetical protein
MRWAVGTLLASSHRPWSGLYDARRAGNVQLSAQLVKEEYSALAGVWRAELELDEGNTAMSLHLAAPQSLALGTIAPGGGKVFPMEEKLPFNICSGNDGWTSARWSAHAAPKNDDELRLSLRLGNLYLEGRGERRGLRCTAFVGTVLEGGEDPCVVGRFSLQLALPLTSDTGALEKTYERRLAARRPPPLEFARAGFVGPWRLLLSVDEDATPAYFGITLNADGSWASDAAAAAGGGDEQQLVGTWGMHSKEEESGSGAHGGVTHGSSVWLKVHRERSTETLRGIGGLPVRSDFYLSGKPVITSAEAELAARAAMDARQEGRGKEDPSSGDVVDRLDGRLWEGTVERAYFGRFSLLRGSATELRDECDSGDDVACDSLSREEEAKRAWLASLAVPTWGPPEEGTDASEVAQLEQDLGEACDKGDDVACESLTREEEAKRAWLARLDAPIWGPRAGAADASEMAQLEQDCKMGVDTACAQLTREEEAKRVWLARLDAPSLGEACDKGDNVACESLSREEESLRTWLGKQGAPSLSQACDKGDDVACDSLSREEEAKRAWLARLDTPTWGPSRKD